MKKIIMTVSIICSFTVANAQMVVVDQTSFLQRMTLFLQEMEETVGQSLDLTDQTSTARATLELSQEAADRLKRVSEFVKSSADVLEISRSGVRISQKIIDYKDRIMQLENVSDEEKYWILELAMDIAEKAAEQATEGLKLAKQGATDGEFTDYERLQIIKDIKRNVLSLECDLDDLISKASSYGNYTGMIGSFRNIAFDASTFGN